MNKKLHRVIFNAARGLRMAVAETARGMGKGAARATVGATAVLALLAAPAVQAQIAANPFAAASQRPQVLAAPNGVPLVNITTPSPAGVSVNQYQQFDVHAAGAILNNSRTTAQTQLGGLVQGNPWLATGAARLIVNQVTSTHPSHLNGTIEVAGQRAEVVIANPSGISVNGAGFINASQVTLTTGVPQYGALGSLDAFLVQGGTIRIEGAGLDAGSTDYAAILSRALQVNAAVHANELKVATGANRISADHGQVTPTAGSGPAPTFALDVAALGGMYARKITLIGTEAGLGVRNAGRIGAGAGGLVVTAAGRLENTGTLEGQSVRLSSGSEIDNRHGTIRQASAARLDIGAPTLSNTDGGWIGAEPIAAGGSTGTGGTGTTGTTSSGATAGAPPAGGSAGSTAAPAPAPTPAAPPEPGAITAAGALLNDGGRIYAGGPIALHSPNIVNRGGTLSVGSLALNQASFSNQDGTLNVSGAFSAQVDRFDNSAGTVRAGSLDIVSAGELVNTGGTLTSEGDAALRAGGALRNDQGRIAAGGDLAIQAASVQSGAGSVLAAGVRADGSLGTHGDLRITTTGLLAAHGTHLAAGSAALQGASVDLSGSQTAARDIAVTATQGHVTTSGATVSTPGTLAVTANSHTGQALVNEAGTLSAGQLDLRAADIANTHGGEIVQTGTGASTIAVGGTLNNDGGRIASNGQDLSLSGAAITNHGGRIEHAGTGTLAIGGGSFQGTDGQITGNGALNVDLAGAFGQDGGSTYAEHIGVQAGSLSNRGGSIVQGGTGATTITVTGAADNTGGTLASNGALHIAAGSLANRSGAIRAAGTSHLGLTTASLLDNRQGEIGAGGNATLDAGALNNDAGRITAAGDLLAHVGGAASNRAGTLAANGSTTLNAGSYDNHGGTTAAVDGDLTVTTGGATTNAGGTMQAGGATLLANAGLDNTQGRIFGERIGVDTHGQQLANAQGTLAATNAVDLQTGALVNDAGLIQSGGAMSIDTHGQSLGNANAAGHASGQGGITSAGALGIDAGAVNNAGGFIGAKGALTANTQDFSNTAGGLVLGQEAVSIHTNGGTYDNAGGQTQAVGELTLSGAGVDNTAGLLRSGGTTTLAVGGGAVLNTGTQAADQGIEGRSVAITAGSLDNAQGAIRANEDLTATVAGVADNTGGLMSAGGTLKIVDPHAADPNAADPAARQLEVINTGGTLVADQGVVVDAARFSGDGTLASGGDLRLAVTQDLTNNAKVVANGDLSYGTTGQLTNNGQLLAGGTLTVSGSAVGNAASGEMSATDTTVTAIGTLTNRGLIDSAGTTRIDAGILNNIGTGRIYGDSVAIGAGQVNNDAETVGGVASSATIAGRLSVDIGATEINNREHALIFSGDAMRIGGALNAQGKATGQGAALNNLSADIESLGGMAISMGKVNNWDVHITKADQPTVTSFKAQAISILGQGIYLPEEVIVIPGQPYVWRRNPDGSQGELLTASGYAIWDGTYIVTTDTAVDPDPSRIVSGGDMALQGHVSNKNSRIVAGGTLTATGGGIHNDSLQGTTEVFAVASVTNWDGTPQAPVAGAQPPITIDLGAYEVTQDANATAGYAMGSAGIGSTGLSAGGAGAAQGGHPAGTIVEVASNVPGVEAGTGSGAGAAGGSAPSIPMVVRTSAPTTTIPAASLFSVHAGAGRYLIETDPRFADYRKWLGSDYLLDHLGVDPDHLLKRLGDGLVEQKLIREQVAQLTGYRYLDGYTSDEAQYTALMDAGATFARQYGLKVGVALTAEQMAQLTSDIVWLVEQTVTLPDGSTRQVLVPQVYVRVRPGDIDGHGALLSAGKFQFDDKAANLVNTGTIAGRELVSINAGTVDNLGGRISGGKVGIQAQVDINNLGGTIDAREALSLAAGRDVNVRTTTGAGALGNVGIDRVAGLYVSGPGGTLSVDAGRDANLVGAQVVNAGSGATAIKAGNDVNLGTVTTTEASVAFGSNMSGSFIRSTEVGTTVSGGGSVRLDAGRDVNARAAGVAAEGDLNVDAGRDIRIGAGRERTDFSYSAHWSSSNALRRKDTTVDAQAHSDNAIGSSFTGKNVTLDADRDIGISGSYVSAQDKLGLDAGRDVNIGVATNSSSTSMSTATQRTPTGLARAMSVPGVMVTIETSIPEPVAGTLLTNKGVRDNAMTQDVTVTGSLLTGASVDIKSGRDTTITGSQIIADHDVSVAAGNNLTVQSAQEAHVQGQGSVVHASGKTNSAGMPAFGVASGMSQTASSSVRQVGSQIVSLDGNVALSSGATYTQTASDVLALGIGADGKAGNIGIRAKNVVIQSADDTQLTVNLSRESHATFGGTANLGIVNTVKSVQALADASQRTNDSRAQALAAASTAVTIGQAISSGGFGSASIGVTQSKGHSHSQSAQVQSVPVGSTISAAGNVSITATGAGAGSNISVVGSAIEGENVSLAADNDVTLASAVGSSNSVSSSQSSQMSAGAALSVGSQTGLVFQGGAGKSSGGGTGLAVAHYNTTVTGAQSVSIASGGDTTMHGAVVTGEKVTASVGGDLSITSPQDVSISTAHDSTAGANVSLCVWWCVGNTVEFSGTVGQGGANSNYVSVGSQQSGIQAGDGGFDVDVAGDTRLVGGVIASTQAAVDAGANNFHTGGSLTMTDVVNQASHDGSGFSVTAGYNTTPSAGYGSVSGGQTGVSAAGISGIAGNTAVRTGDPSGGVQPGPSADSILSDVNAQVQITSAFLSSAGDAWGRYANGRYSDAIAAGDEEAAACWAPDGACRAGGHSIIGFLGGGVGGALGAGISSATMPDFIAFLRANDVPEPLVQTLAAAAAGTLGAVVGGTAGAVGAYNEATNNAVMAVPLIVEALVAAGQAAVLACARTPACVAVVGAAALEALGVNSSSSNDGSDGSGSNGGALPPDTYGMPPNGAAPPPEDDSPQRGVGGHGWRGDQNWRAAVREVAGGGTIENIGGIVPTRQEAVALLRDARATILRIEGPHAPPNPHSYPHINYVTAGGLRGTVRIIGL